MNVAIFVAATILHNWAFAVTGAEEGVDEGAIVGLALGVTVGVTVGFAERTEDERYKNILIKTKNLILKNVLN